MICSRGWRKSHPGSLATRMHAAGIGPQGSVKVCLWHKYRSTPGIECMMASILLVQRRTGTLTHHPRRLRRLGLRSTRCLIRRTQTGRALSEFGGKQHALPGGLQKRFSSLPCCYYRIIC